MNRPHKQASLNRAASKSKLLSVFELVAAVSLGAAGCSSINGRGDDRFYPGPFPGLAYHQAEYANTTGGSEPSHEEVERRLLGLMDFPFTLALDTALLPWDLLYRAFQRDSTNNVSR